MTDNLLDQSNPDPQIDPNKNYLAELVGEGKKFKTQEDLARGKYEADSYIKILERTRDEMRDDYLKLKSDYEARAKLEEIADQLLNKQQLASSDHTRANEVNQQPEIDLNKIESLVTSKIQQNELAKKREENSNLVKTKLVERFGNNYRDAVKQQIDALEISEEDFNDMARNRPKFLIRTLGLDEPVKRDSFQTPPQSTQRFIPAGAEKRTWSYYQKMKKESPKLYSDPKTAVQMQKDYIELGSEFEDGDFRNM